jgi:hypothetical protein
MAIGSCVVYRVALAAGKEKQFISACETMTQEIREHADAIVEGCDPILRDPVAHLLEP